MRIVATLIPLLALGAAQPAAAPPSSFAVTDSAIAAPMTDCRSLQIAAARRPATFRRLGDLPPAEAYQAVLRTGADGCPDPLLVSERIGWTGQKPSE